jgi:hypothetical protein
MHFQIYIPNARGQDPQTLIDVGLADFYAGAEFVETAAGPGDKGPGVVVAWRKPGQAQMGYQPERQVWLPAAASGEDLAAGRYWIGFWTDSPPTPKDLARPYPQPGHRVALGDGSEWILPIAKAIDADMIRADDGTWRFDPQRRFHAFWMDYLKWFHFFGNWNEEAVIDYGEAADFVLAGLRVNYRLPDEVTNHLRLFTKENVLTSLLAIMGIDRDAVGS